MLETHGFFTFNKIRRWLFFGPREVVWLEDYRIALPYYHHFFTNNYPAMTTGRGNIGKGKQLYKDLNV
jgi:hypothetical protein